MLSNQAMLTFVSVLVNGGASYITYRALQFHGDEVVRKAVSDTTTHGIVDLHSQCAITMASIVILLCTAFVTISDKKGKVPFFIGWGCVIASVIAILLLMGGGFQEVPLAPYADKHPSSALLKMLPPFDSWLTQLRIAFIVLQLLLLGIDPISALFNSSNSKATPNREVA